MIPAGWEIQDGANLALKITKGASPRWQGFEYQDSGVMFVTSENVRDGYLDISEPKFLPMEFHHKLKNSQLKKGDILINLVGASIGRVCRYDPSDEVPANINQAVCLFRPNGAVLSEYLLYYLQESSVLERLLGQQTATARPNLSLGDIRSFKFLVPPSKEQRKIAEILSCWDDGLNQYQKYLRTLQLLKDAILQRFLRSIPQGDEEVGEIVKIGDIADFVERGITPKYSDATTEFPVLNQKAIRWGIIDNTCLKFLTSEFADTVESSLQIRNGDIVINSTGDGTIGRAFCFKSDPNFLIPDSHVTLIRTKSIILPEFLVAVIETAEGQHQIYRLVNGSTGQIELPPSGIRAFSFHLPPMEVQQKVVQIISNIQEAYLRIEKTISQLGQQKQALMQKLLTGKIRVKV